MSDTENMPDRIWVWRQEGFNEGGWTTDNPCETDGEYLRADKAILLTDLREFLKETARDSDFLGMSLCQYLIDELCPEEGKEGE